MQQVAEFEGCPLAWDLEGDGPPLLFVQGVGVHGEGWRPQLAELSPRFACLTFDNRGLGRSRPAAKEISVTQMALDAFAVMDAAGFASAHVVGHSLGGLVAQQMALVARERVKSLSLMCTFAGGPASAPLTPKMLWWGLRSRLGTRPMRRRGFLHLLLAPQAIAATDLDRLAAELEPLFGHDLADLPDIADGQLKALARCNLARRLGELRGVPVLVLTGAHDPIAPPTAGRQLAAGIPFSRYVEVQDASHGLPITHPAQVNRLLAEHFAQSGAPRS